ncbi:MAG: alanine-zipper protein [Woeseiaceae bacterium]
MAQNPVFTLQQRSVWEIMPLQFFPTKEPSNMKKTALKASALALFVALAAGCANNDEISATADRAAADAAAAASAAEAARAAADRASQAASAAQRTADQALAAASEAQACCEANRESMERMFQKSMSK